MEARVRNVCDAVYSSNQLWSRERGRDGGERCREVVGRAAVDDVVEKAKVSEAARL